jgi:hypothetical protein
MREPGQLEIAANCGASADGCAGDCIARGGLAQLRAQRRRATMSRMRRLLLSLCLPLVACSHSDSSSPGPGASSPTDACTSQYSTSKGYGYGSDGPYATSPADGGAQPAPPDAVELAVSNCMSATADASACDRSRLVTRDAALCIAKADGLSTGIAPWTASLVFQVKLRRIVWNVDSTTASSASGSSSGDSMTLDAITGAVLATGQWGATP